MDITDYLPLRRKWKDAGLDINRCTCQFCQKRMKCPLTFDLSNINGNCVIEKIKKEVNP